MSLEDCLCTCLELLLKFANHGCVFNLFHLSLAYLLVVFLLRIAYDLAS